MKKYASLLSLIVVFLAAFWGFYDLKPFSVPSENIAGFSIDNALNHLKEIAVKPHYPGTEDHKRVQNYLVDELTKLGLEPKIQTQTVINKKWFAGTTVENIVAQIKGTGNGKALLLLSHYDSNPHSSIGASDAGSGVVTILEGIRVFLANNKTPKNDIIIVFSDAEELGLLGAKAFVEYHPWAKDVELVLNFEARGSGGASYMLMETNGKNSKMVSEYLKANPTYPAGNSLLYSIYKKLPNDTDLTVFREIGDINGFNFAFIGDHFDYHTAQDSYERLDRTTLAHQADYLMNTLTYFASSDIENLNSDKDLVYVNFPIIKVLKYPFSWVFTLKIVALLVLLVLLFFGIAANKADGKYVLLGFVPALITLLGSAGLSFGLWKLIVLINPSYNDMLHGFTYNGYWYIAAFVSMNIWFAFFVYRKYTKSHYLTSLSIAPIAIWLLINFIIPEGFEGAGFFIIPILIAELILFISVIKKPMDKNYSLLYAVLSIPTVYIFAPLIKLFPVGLGLKMLFISGILVALLFGLLIPAINASKARKGFQKLFGLVTVVLFIVAFTQNGFNKNNKRPNSLVYIQNTNDSVAYWGTYNTTLDPYISQKLGDKPTKGGITNAETKSKYNTRFKFHKKADFIPVAASEVIIQQDTIIDNDRLLELSIVPKRKINKYELSVGSAVDFKKLTANQIPVNNGNSFSVKKGSFLLYYMANADDSLHVSLTVDKLQNVTIFLNEISYDLLKNPAFTIKPRTKEMMPMPFVNNDAIMNTQKIQLD